MPADRTEIPAWFLDRWLACAVLPVGIGAWQVKPGWRTRRSHRKSYEIYYVLDGSMVASASGRDEVLLRNTVCILPPGLPFVDGDGPEGVGTHMLVARFTVMAGRGFDPLQALGLPVSVPLRRPGIVNRALRDLAQPIGERDLGDPRQRLRVRNFIDLIVGQFLIDGFAQSRFAAVASDPLPKWLWHVLAFIENRLEHPQLSVASLAREAGFSESHFTHQFRHFLRTSPKKWVLGRRMAKARNLLLSEPHLPICEVAEICGFSDQFQFSRTFSRRLGVAPSAWRKLVTKPGAKDEP